MLVQSWNMKTLKFTRARIFPKKRKKGNEKYRTQRAVDFSLVSWMNSAKDSRKNGATNGYQQICQLFSDLNKVISHWWDCSSISGLFFAVPFALMSVFRAIRCIRCAARAICHRIVPQSTDRFVRNLINGHSTPSLGCPPFLALRRMSVQSAFLIVLLFSYSFGILKNFSQLISIVYYH